MKKILVSSLLLILMLSSCTTVKTNEASGAPEGVKDQRTVEILAPPDIETNGPAVDTQGEKKEWPRPITLVLGPALARGYVFAGILEVLDKEGIPIERIYCSEMGALMAGLYSTSSNINDFEWRLMFLEEKHFRKPKSFWGGGGTDGKDLEDLLDKLFKKIKIEQTRTPIEIGFFSEESNRAEIFPKTEYLSSALRVALSVPGFVSSTQKRDGSKLFSSIITQPIPPLGEVDILQNPVVVVDALDDASGHACLGASELELQTLETIENLRKNYLIGLEKADAVLRPDFGSIGLCDYKKKARLILIGKKTAYENISKLKELAFGVSNQGKLE